MPSVAVTEHLLAPVDAVWARILDVESYPRLMPSVRVVEQLEAHVGADGREEAVVAWEVELEGSVLRWVEREWRDPRRHRVEFTQIAGDLEQFDGHWQLEPAGDRSTLASLEIAFEIGIPMLAEVLDPFAAEAIATNSTEMLRSLGARMPSS